MTRADAPEAPRNVSLRLSRLLDLSPISVAAALAAGAANGPRFRASPIYALGIGVPRSAFASVWLRIRSISSPFRSPTIGPRRDMVSFPPDCCSSIAWERSRRRRWLPSALVAQNAIVHGALAGLALWSLASRRAIDREGPLAHSLATVMSGAKGFFMPMT